MKESFIIYKGYYEPIKSLTDEQLGQLFRCIFNYQIDGIEPTINDSIYMAFQFFKNQFRLDEDKYQKVIERNKNNGSKGGRPKLKQEPNETQKTHSVILKPKKADNDNDNVNDINNIHPIQKYIKEDLKNVSKLPIQLKYEDCERLLLEFNKETIKDILLSMENYKELTKKYTSVNLTLRNWIKKDNKPKQSNKHNGLV